MVLGSTRAKGANVSKPKKILTRKCLRAGSKLKKSSKSKSKNVATKQTESSPRKTPKKASKAESREASSPQSPRKTPKKVASTFIAVTEESDVSIVAAPPPLTAEEKESRSKRRLLKQKVNRLDRQQAAKEESGTKTWPMPPTKAESRALDMKSVQGSSKNAILSQVMGFHEVKKKRFETKTSKPVLLRLMCLFPHCKFRCTAGYRKNRQEGASFVVSEWVDHDCTTEVGSKTLRPGADPTKKSAYKFFPPSAFSAPALAPVLEPRQKVKPADATTMLENYTVATPGLPFVSKVLSLSRKPGESDEERTSHISNYCKLLRNAGHHAEYTTTDCAGMAQIMVSNAKANHALLVKSVPDASEVDVFDPDSVDLSVLKEGARYLTGWTYASESDMEMVTEEKTSNVFNADAAHCNAGGTLYRLNTFDAGGHVVPALDGWDARTEATPPWAGFGAKSLALYGGKLNSDAVVVVSDRDKGLRAGFHSSVDKAHSRHCHNHLKNDVMASCGAEMGSIFEDIAYAKSDAQFEAALAKANPKLKAMLAKLEKGEYCNFYCGAALHGCTASQGVEAMNGADSASKNGVRLLHPAKMLEALAEAAQGRFLRRRDEATTHAGPIAPLVKKRMEKSMKRLVESTHIGVTFKGKQTDRTNVVLTIGEKKRTRKVIFKITDAQGGLASTCECGAPALDDSPCGCMLLAAEKAGIPWEQLLDESDTMEEYRKQYADLPEYAVPGTEQLMYMNPDPFLMPPVELPVNRGRPSTKRKLGVVEKWKKTSTAAKKARGAAAQGAAAGDE